VPKERSFAFASWRERTAEVARTTKLRGLARDRRDCLCALTFELSGPPTAWPARRIIDNESRAGQAVGGSALERRVRPHSW
jgi:hypothetical protein